MAARAGAERPRLGGRAEHGRQWRWAQGDPARFPTLAAELVRLNVDVIVAPDEGRVNAVRQATHTIPIVFCFVGDPVAVGYAASLARPGGMITGISSQWRELVGKRLEILKEALPNVKPVAVLANPPAAAGFAPGAAALLKNFEVASKSLGLPYQTYLASEPGDLDSALATMVQKGARSLTMVSGTGLFFLERKRIADLALRYRLPTMAESRLLVEAGCLMSYAANIADLLRRTAALRRQDPQGRQAWRSAHRAADEVRVRDQPQDREGPRPHDPAGGAGAGGRGYRVVSMLRNPEGCPAFSIAPGTRPVARRQGNQTQRREDGAVVKLRTPAGAGVPLSPSRAPIHRRADAR